MTLLITVLAAVIATTVWYFTSPSNLKLGVLSWMYWGASLMWLADAIMEYIADGADYFTPAPEDMLNDAFLGFSAVTLGLIIWLAILLWNDPRGVIRNALFTRVDAPEEKGSAQEVVQVH